MIVNKNKMINLQDIYYCPNDPNSYKFRLYVRHNNHFYNFDERKKYTNDNKIFLQCFDYDYDKKEYRFALNEEATPDLKDAMAKFIKFSIHGYTELNYILAIQKAKFDWIYKNRTRDIEFKVETSAGRVTI